MDSTAKEKRPVRVTIAGHSFTLVTAGEDREVLELAHRVDELISEISTRSSSIDSTRLAILASLHLADELQRRERELKLLREKVHTTTQHFQGLLEIIDDAS